MHLPCEKPGHKENLKTNGNFREKILKVEYNFKKIQGQF